MRGEDGGIVGILQNSYRVLLFQVNIFNRGKMMKVVLVSCVKTKRKYPCKASEMYKSFWFKRAYQYALAQNPDKIFILSAKYGLLESDEVIEPYERKLSTRTTERKDWATYVIQKLSQKCNLQQDDFIILAGVAYREYLLPHISNYSIPFEKLRQGEQNSFLKKYFQNN